MRFFLLLPLTMVSACSGSGSPEQLLQLQVELEPPGQASSASVRH